MRRTMTSLVFVVLGALVATTSAIAATVPTTIDTTGAANAPAVRWPTPTTTAPPVFDGSSLLVSDSAWLGMPHWAGVDQVQGFEHTLSLKSCRRRVAPSCDNRGSYQPITLYEEVERRGSGHRTLIVATGYNDSDHRFTEEVDAIVSLARSQGYERIVWLTLRSNVAYTSPGNAGNAAVFERSNATLEQIVADGTYPELVIADWATYAQDRPEWFKSTDGIHLRNLGGYAAGDYISRKMAFLDGRVCPQPAYAGVAPIDPCPDPDAHGPVIDLESLYPVGQRQGLAFSLSFEGSSSWPNPPWWE